MGPGARRIVAENGSPITSRISGTAHGPKAGTARGSAAKAGTVAKAGNGKPANKSGKAEKSGNAGKPGKLNGKAATPKEKAAKPKAAPAAGRSVRPASNANGATPTAAIRPGTEPDDVLSGLIR